MKIFEGRVIKAVSSRFFADIGGDVKVCYARKKLKADGDIYVGDRVRVVKDRDSFVIEDVLPRKNSLVRPYVANVDVCFIVIAPEPQPDFVLVDKIIVNCLKQDVVPVLVVNKCDMARVDVNEYKNVLNIVFCSALDGEGVQSLAKLAKGKTACFAGQSAVGKSSLINSLLDEPILEVGELAKKIKRGKNTTRRTEILALGEETYLVDTCGFSMLEAMDMPPEELRLYYDDMEEYRKDCRFNMCMHVSEPDCAVKAHVGNGVGKGRYERYLSILAELKQKAAEKFD